MGVIYQRGILALLGAFAIASAAGCVAPAPPSAAERTFIKHVSHVLGAQFPTMRSAEGRGYVPISDKLDADNTYNLSDMEFAHVTLERPNFLWYDRAGRLVGVDYEFAKSAYKTPPATYPVEPSRWSGIDEHVHLSYTLNGKTVYAEDGARSNLRSAHISASDLRTDGLLPKGAVLNWAMYHPAAWDLALWLVPNPKGAFADSNPLVK